MLEPFQVYARIRPLNQKEIQLSSGKIGVNVIDSSTLAVGDAEVRETYFQVDQVFGEDVTNEEIFEKKLQDVVHTFLNGINSTILAYGITGAGKSHTMFGSQGQNWQAGLIELALQYLFEEIEGKDGTRVSISYMEIYNQQVFDLLKPKSDSLQILDDPLLGVVVNDLEEVQIRCSRSAQGLIELGNTRRVVAETKANEFSSRSHAIVQISLERPEGDSIVTAKLSLVDLAGSQRQNVYAEQKGLRNLEGSNINRSLLTLGNCITALSQKKKGNFVPYRDSKLTRLLKDSLGGNTKTVMIACISPSVLSCDQTMNTMKYACRARKIEKVVHNNVRDNRTNEDLRRQIVRLKKEREQNPVCISKEEMQQLITKLIRNVQELTLVRSGQSCQLACKIKEIELIEEQGKIVGSILSKCDNEQERQPKQLVRSKTTDLVQERRNRFAKNISTAELNAKLVNDSSQILKLIPENNQENELIMMRPMSNRMAKNSVFVRGNLQSIRSKHQRQKKYIRELVCQYQDSQGYDSARKRVIDKAKGLLCEKRQQHQFLSTDDRNVLAKMINEQQLDELDLIHYCPEDKLPSSHYAQQPNNPCIRYDLQPKEQGNRFLTSLQQIRRMMRRVSSTLNKVQQQPIDGQQDEIEILECSKQLLFAQ